MTIRLHVDRTLVELAEFDLPEAAARHAQVRRVQPGDALRLFDGRGHEHVAQVLQMGRKAVAVRVGAAWPALPEMAQRLTLAVGMPANERMDTLVEKATELGVHAIQPLECERSVLRLSGERAQRKREHWQAVAVAASEQCGRAWVPQVAEVCPLSMWLQALPQAKERVAANSHEGSGTGSEADAGAGEARGADGTAEALRLVLSFSPAALSPQAALQGRPVQHGDTQAVHVLSGPEGGLSPAEEAAARAAGFQPVTLGPRVLRADTAPLALLAWWGLRG
ncbi:MAG: 16S rRNA (uracil(1498)-N(3))-methyltransferase [Rubrivivax sp.]|jgi:16S rRNA (uracil1498-N3)-methyltransferase|nr:16S rRNA (uracil(1498)-N(3))-methyltransferase [Rubrivivax sp.]